jgi:zinc protease
LKTEPIAANELQKLKNRAESQQAFGDVGAANKAMNLAFYELIGDANLINTEIDRYNAVEIKDIQRVANAIFKVENSTLLFYKAKKGEAN